MNLNTEKEFIIKFEGELDHLEGRITVNQTGQNYSAEINLVMAESGKIYKHVKCLFNISSEKEAVSNSVQLLNNYLVSL